jgi:hypothetical protein
MGVEAMDTVARWVFFINLSLLLLHEMDAVRRGEWRMFPFLKTLPEERAYRLFTLLHLPLYTLLLWLLGEGAPVPGMAAVDLLLVAHAVLHRCCEGHPGNAFRSRFSRSIIYAMAGLALLHLALGIAPESVDLFWKVRFKGIAV